MKKVVLRIIIAIAVAAFPLLAGAYGRGVHKTLTHRALDAIDDLLLSQRLGVNRSTQFGGKSLLEWAKQGAHDEDKTLPGEQPKALQPGFRPLNHFFDPVHRAPLTTPLSPFGCTTHHAEIIWPWLILNYPGSVFDFSSTRADEWGLLAQRNTMNLAQAKEFYWDAVTASTKSQRDEATKNLFRSFGHILHLIQDMAQPEHTRNDQHMLAFFAVEPSLYEAFADRALASGQLNSFMATTYPEVNLGQYGHYFTKPSPDPFVAGEGMADYSNRNFLTQDTAYHDQANQIRCYEYAHPHKGRTTTRLEKDVTHLVRAPIHGFVYKTVDEQILTLSLEDGFQPSLQEQDRFHAIYSSIDLEAQIYVGANVYSLDDRSFESRARRLIPRAVGYSAGFLKRFFRGKISAAWQEVGGLGWTAIVRNDSSETLHGDAEISLSYCPGSAYLGSSNDCAVIMEAPLALWDANGLNPGESVLMTNLQVPQLKSGDRVTDFEQRVAVRGTLGSSSGEVIGVVQPKIPRLKWLVRFDEFVPAGATMPFFWEVNISAGNVWGFQDGALAAGIRNFPATSAVYAPRSAGGKITFWWGSPAASPQFLLINGEREATYFIQTSASRLFDGPVSQTVRLMPFEQRIVLLPPAGVSRFSIFASAPVFYAIDDVAWD